MQDSFTALLVSLVPYILGSALVPIYIVLVVLLLKNPNQGLVKGIAFLAGLTLTRLVQGIVFGFVLMDAAASTAPDDKGLVVSTMLMGFGIIFLISAYKKWRKQTDSDDPPKWLIKIDNLTPAKAFGFGAGLPLISVKLWVFTLGALGTIAEEQLGQTTSITAYLIFIFLAQLLLLIPILIRLILPARAQSILDKISAWLTKYNRAIVVGVSLVFGLLFLFKGISGLLA